MDAGSGGGPGRQTAIDRAIAFYRDQLGFDLDHHTQAAGMNFAQLTPPGSGCSIVIGELPGGPAMAPGSLKGLQLVVADAYRAREELLARGVQVGEIHVLDDRDGGRCSDSPTPTAIPGSCNRSRLAPSSPLLPRRHRSSQKGGDPGCRGSAGIAIWGGIGQRKRPERLPPIRPVRLRPIKDATSATPNAATTT